MHLRTLEGTGCLFDVWRIPGRFTKNPDIIRFPTGKLMLVFCDCDKHWPEESSRITTLESNDGGASWGNPRVVAEALISDGDERWLTPQTIAECHDVGLDDEGHTGEPYSIAAACRASRRLEVVAGADLRAERREAFGERWSVPALYADYRQMVAQEAPDLVAVCSTASGLQKPASEAPAQSFAATPTANCWSRSWSRADPPCQCDFPLGIRGGAGSDHTARGVTSSSCSTKSPEPSNPRCRWPG